MRMARNKITVLLLWRFEVSVDQSFGLHVVQVGNAVRALQTPAHGVGGRVMRQWVGAVQDCNKVKHTQRRKLKTMKNSFKCI